MVEWSRCGWAANGDGACATVAFPAFHCESIEAGSTVTVFLSGTFVYIKERWSTRWGTESLAVLESFSMSVCPIRRWCSVLSTGDKNISGYWWGSLWCVMLHSEAFTEMKCFAWSCKPTNNLLEMLLWLTWPFQITQEKTFSYIYCIFAFL